MDSWVLMKHYVGHLQRFTSNLPLYDDMSIMAEGDLRFAHTAAQPCSCSAAHRGPPPGRRRRRAVETYAGLDRGDAFGGRDAELACVWRHGAGARRRWEEGAINTQGVCAYLSRTIKVAKRHQCFNNGSGSGAPPETFARRLLARLQPRWVQRPRRPIFTAAQVVLLKSVDEREARKAASGR